jgi:hypothetical protein
MTDDRKYVLGKLAEIEQLIAAARDAAAKLPIDDTHHRIASISRDYHAKRSLSLRNCSMPMRRIGKRARSN